MNIRNSLSHWHFIDNKYLLHKDGTISVIARIKGYDIYVEDASFSNSILNSLRNLIDNAPLNLSLEFHLKRRKDILSPKLYMQRDIKRQADILYSLREAYINHIADYLYTNSIYLILQYHKEPSLVGFFDFWSSKGLERSLKGAYKRTKILDEYCDKVAASIDGFNILNSEDATRFLYESSHHSYCNLLPDNSYSLDEILIPCGEVRNGFYAMNSIKIKPTLIYFYPQPNMRLITDMLACLPLELDIAFYLRRCDYGSLLRKSGSEEIKQQRQVSDIDAEGERRLYEIAQWRRYVVNNGLQIFSNVLYFKLYGEEQELKLQCNALHEQFSALGAIIESERLTNYSMIYSLPCNMYRSGFKREDHTDMVLSMIPAVEFNIGNGYEEGFLAANFTFTGFDFTNRSGGEFYHSMTIAKTGSGKGVLNCARIIQLYGLGYDFYAIEIGSTYEFLFNLLGGSYVTIDPDSTVINPFPPINEVSDNFKSALLSPTIRSMAKIFTDGRNELSIHEIAVCELAFKEIYKTQYIKKNNIKHAPNLSNFYQGLANINDSPLNDKQKNARDDLLKNIQSFLDTIIGERFKMNDTLTVNDGIFGADFKKLKDDSQLMMVYLTFLSLRYGQKALFQKTPTFIIIDELHEFIRVDKESIRTLCSQIARMGRKEQGYINLITQEASDITDLDSSLVNQMHIVNLLYTENNHKKLQEYFASFNDRAADIWQEYEQTYSNYRAALVGFGSKWTDSFLTYPKEIMALADTSSRMLAVKKNILNNNSDIKTAYKELLDYYEK